MEQNKIDMKEYIDKHIIGEEFEAEKNLYNTKMGEMSGYLSEQDVAHAIDKIKVKSFMMGVEYANKWVCIEDKLPELGYRVLFKDEFGVAHIGYIDMAGDWRYCLNNRLICSSILEWKPIK